MAYNEKELARLVKEAGKSRLIWQKNKGEEMVTNGHWAVFSEAFDVKVRVALFAAFAGREIKNGECLAMINGELFTNQDDIIHLHEPDEATDIGIITPFIIGVSPDHRGEVHICNFGESSADLYGINLDYIALTDSRSCYRRLDDEKSPLYFGDEKQIMITPVKGQWDDIIKKYAGLYRDKENYISAMFGASESTGNAELDDAKYQEAKLIVIQNQQASVSLLQRKLRLGYTMAARVIERMESEGIVGPYQGNKPREVLIGE